VALATAAGAAGGGLLGTGLFAPPPPRPVATPAAPAAGAAAPTLLQVEQKLSDLHFDPGAVDGNSDDDTGRAVLAFQKVNGLDRTGQLTDALAAQIMATTAPPAPMVADGEPSRVEVSLARQVLFLYENGSLTKILPVATGASGTPTPTGTFHVYRFDPGWHTSALGRLYNAEYFVGGYAIHGSTSVPAQPASHGCIRISMGAADWFPNHVHNGTQVVVLPN